jgi:hypothetical protein
LRGGIELTLLVVGVRNLKEALAAAKGGADILDVKNPTEGSLGANFPWVIAAIRQAVPSKISVSASIGDFPDLPGSAALASFGAIKAGAEIVKVGLRGPKNARDAVWFLRKVVEAARSADKSARVAACAYGDFERAKTIDPSSLPEIAERGGVDIAMLDTAIKDRRPLLEFLGVEDLRKFVAGARSRGLLAALSGSLGIRELRLLRQLAPDIIGLRGVACEGGNRKSGRISESKVRRLKKLLSARDSM